MPKSQHIYRIAFLNQGKVYEIYARQVYQGALYGFVEVEELVFGNGSSVVVDPSEERLKSEFQGVRRSYIPIHSVVRIDEVEREGSAKIVETAGGDGKVTPFPVYTPGNGR